jgi:hypothetical protein
VPLVHDREECARPATYGVFFAVSAITRVGGGAATPFMIAGIARLSP